MSALCKGALLVATPRLGDPNFDRTVVLVLQYGEGGAVGVVLNRPSDTEVEGALPGWDAYMAEPPVFFVGGPVAQGGVIGLARMVSEADVDGWSPVVGAVGTVDLDADADAVGPVVEEVRLFAGYAGWGPGQLEGEIEAGAWFVVDGRADDALSSEPDRLWSAVLRRQRGPLALLSAFPADVSLN